MVQHLSMRSRASLVGIATVYGLDGWGSIRGRGKRFFTIPQRQNRLWGPPGLASNKDSGLLSLGIKRLGREADHSPPCSAEVKMEQYLQSPICIHGIILNKLSIGTTLLLGSEGKAIPVTGRGGQ
jgi:hypothetical protein